MQTASDVNIKGVIELCTIHGQGSFYYDSRLGTKVSKSDIHPKYLPNTMFVVLDITSVSNIIRPTNLNDSNDVFYYEVELLNGDREQGEAIYCDFDNTFIIRKHNPLKIITSIISNPDFKSIFIKNKHPAFIENYKPIYNVYDSPQSLDIEYEDDLNTHSDDEYYSVRNNFVVERKEEPSSNENSSSDVDPFEPRAYNYIDQEEEFMSDEKNNRAIQHNNTIMSLVNAYDNNNCEQESSEQESSEQDNNIFYLRKRGVRRFPRYFQYPTYESKTPAISLYEIIHDTAVIELNMDIVPKLESRPDNLYFDSSMIDFDKLLNMSKKCKITYKTVERMQAASRHGVISDSHNRITVCIVKEIISYVQHDYVSVTKNSILDNIHIGDPHV